MYPDNRHKMPPYKFKTTNQEETREKGETRPPPVPLDDKPPRVKSVLHIAVARGDLAAVERYLRKDGIPVDLIAEDGLSPLHWSIVSKDPGPMINLLLEHHANVNVRSVPEGATPLMHATQRKLLDAVVILLDNGADINAADKSGFTSLHRACEMGSTEIVKILLERGADANVQAEVGHTPLSLAKLRKEHAVVDLLESHQASADERQVESNTITLCQRYVTTSLLVELTMATPVPSKTRPTILFAILRRFQWQLDYPWIVDHYIRCSSDFDRSLLLPWLEPHFDPKESRYLWLYCFRRLCWIVWLR
jgi:hypothetical protein